MSSYNYSDPVRNQTALKPGEKLAELRCTQGEHYKRYIVWLIHEGDTWAVRCFWGRIGYGVDYQEKHASEDRTRAKAVFDKWVNKKQTPHGIDSNFYNIYALTKGNTVQEFSTQLEALEVQLNSLEKISQGKKGRWTEKDGKTSISFIEL